MIDFVIFMNNLPAPNFLGSLLQVFLKCTEMAPFFSFDVITLNVERNVYLIFYFISLNTNNVLDVLSLSI